MNTEFERVSLPLEYPFTIARGTQKTAENIIVKIEDEGGTVGIGGAAPSSYYGETI
ncbi:MAG: dipeptide epimerase, partial [Halobacteriaceae archaeon]